MNALILYDSKYGNTQRIAQAVAEALGTARVASVMEAARIDLAACDLLVVGGPTHVHGASREMREALDAIPRGSLRGVPVAAFDTRYDQARWLTGSAALYIARRLRRAGAHLVAPPESFFVVRDTPPEGEKPRHDHEQLAASEVERAGAWGRALIARSEASRQPVGV